MRRVDICDCKRDGIVLNRVKNAQVCDAMKYNLSYMAWLMKICKILWTSTQNKNLQNRLQVFYMPELKFILLQKFLHKNHLVAIALHISHLHFYVA